MIGRTFEMQDTDYLMVQEAALDVFAEYFWRSKAMGDTEQRILRNLREKSRNP
jgi:hypothetical protein